MLILPQFIKSYPIPIPFTIFERVTYNRQGEYMDSFLNKLLCGFKKAILINTRYLNYYIVGKKSMITLFRYDCLPQYLIIAKCEAYGLSKKSLKLLLGQKQRLKIGSLYSFWSDVKKGLPQGLS